MSGVATTGTTAAMLRSQIRLEQRIFWRNRSGVFFTFVLPLALMVALGLSGDPLENLPVVAALAVLSTGFQGLGIQLAMHRDQGVLKRLMSTPLPASVLILGKVVSIASVIALELVIIVGTGVLAFGAPAPAAPVALVAFALLGTATYVALGFAVASLIPTSESAPAITNAAYLGLLLLTGVVRSLDGLPEWARHSVDLLPFVPLLEPLKQAWVGPWHGVPWQHAAVLAVWFVVGAAWTGRRFRWEPSDR